MKNQLVLLVTEMHDSGILYSEAVREFKKSFLSHVLQQNRGNQSKAAKLLGMHRNTLSRTLAELELDVRLLRKASTEPGSTQYKDKIATGNGQKIHVILPVASAPVPRLNLIKRRHDRPLACGAFPPK